MTLVNIRGFTESGVVTYWWGKIRDSFRQTHTHTHRQIYIYIPLCLDRSLHLNMKKIIPQENPPNDMKQNKP